MYLFVMCYRGCDEVMLTLCGVVVSCLWSVNVKLPTVVVYCQLFAAAFICFYIHCVVTVLHATSF